MTLLCNESQHSASVAQTGPRTSVDVWGEKERSQRLRGHACAAPRLSDFRDDEGKHRVCLYTGPCPAPRQTHLRAEARTHYDGGEK